MDSDKLTKLLISAMERHITWEQENENIWKLTTDTDVALAPYAVPEGWPDNLNNHPVTDTLSVREFSLSTKELRGRRRERMRQEIDVSLLSVALEHQVRAGDWAEFWESSKTESGQELAQTLHDIPENRFLTIQMRYGLFFGPIDGLTEDNTHAMTLFDLLAFLAAQDARDAGRLDDVAALMGSIPYYNGMEDKPITEAQAAEILALISEENAYVPALEGLKPNRHVVPNSKPSQVLTNPILFEGIQPLNVGGKGKGHALIGFGLSWDEGKPPTGVRVDPKQPLDQYDRDIIEAISTLYERGNRTITPFQIAETMADSPSADRQKDIHERALKMNAANAYIDWTEEARRKNKSNPDTGLAPAREIKQEHLLEFSTYYGIDEGGNPYVRYELLSEPILYQHARATGQVVNYPQRLLDIKPIDATGREKKRISADQRKVMRTILWWVHILKNPKAKMNSTMSYERLWDRAGVRLESDKQRQRAVRDITDYLRALEGKDVIKGFKVNTEGQGGKPASVTIYTDGGKRRKR